MRKVNVAALESISKPLSDIRRWARENDLEPYLILDKDGTIMGLVKTSTDAEETAKRWGVKYYPLTTFSGLGFWIDTHRNEYASNLPRIIKMMSDKKDFWSLVDIGLINETLDRYGATMIPIRDARAGLMTNNGYCFFVSFKDKEGLTMFNLLWS